MFPTRKQIKVLVLEIFSHNKICTKNELYAQIATLLKLSEDELKIKTKGGFDNKLDNSIRWVLTDLNHIKFIQRVGKGYKITKFGNNFCKLIIDKQI